ncbi:hypothetical protein [Caulobacter endophyticus]|uniref:hypothetical protein n=1 Tax=Caulobacter endophyticus TaxID=2172652 RepID=UPI00240EB29F|nr:hypothetical protein [Caulobacter endophyticus]MDG2530857.1 hypothetical protein [Caulobacter endophyticus]
MRMTMAVLAVATATLWAQSATAQTVAASPGDCLWNSLSETDRTEVLTAYDRNMNSATKALAAHDKAVQAAAAACVGKEGAPPIWIQYATSSAMIRAASARRLAPKGLTPENLRAIWNAADPAVRTCFRANAARVYGPMADKLMKGETCPDKSIAERVVTAARIDMTDRPNAAQALIHFNAIAQADLAEGLLAAFVRYSSPAS